MILILLAGEFVITDAVVQRDLLKILFIFHEVNFRSTRLHLQLSQKGIFERYEGCNLKNIPGQGRGPPFLLASLAVWPICL